MSNKKQTIEDVYEYCRKINLKCLSKDYINSKSKLAFECNVCGSTFPRTFSDLKKNGKNTCASCSGKNRESDNKLEAFQKVLTRCKELGLKCLSSEYVNNKTNMLFECTICNNDFERCWSVLEKSDATICKSCTAKEIVNAWKYKIEEVDKIFRDNGCKLVSLEYISNKSPLEYVCECGEESTITLSHFLQGQRCRDCSIVKAANSKRTSYDVVKKVFEDAGCILISETFKNSNEDLDYICSCGTKSVTRLGRFKSGTRCRVCAGVDSPTIDEVREFFEDNDCKLISSEYINSKNKLKFICQCGKEHKMSWEKFKTSPYKRCRDCANKLNGERIKGDKHPFYNPNLTDEHRADRRTSSENKKWRYEVYKKDDYTCQCCGTRNNDLNAHHKDGYNWCKDRRYDVENGVTLCIDCHKKFHKTFGYGNNTEAQYDEFISNKHILHKI